MVEYEGTQYQGFQWQPGALTIQGQLESSLERLTGETVRVDGAGRTDSGVHARGQVVSFRVFSQLPPETFVKALNYYLPEDISVTQAFRVPETFNVQRNACSREYRYTILNRRTPSPLLIRFSHIVREPLDVPLMDDASRLLIGPHDFAAFSSPQELGSARTLRRVLRAGVSRDGDLVIIEMEGNAFLSHQVRRTAGALVEVGMGKMSVEEFQGLLERKEPGSAGPTLPAKGLCLVKVTYPDSIFEDHDTNEDL